MSTKRSNGVLTQAIARLIRKTLTRWRLVYVIWWAIGVHLGWGMSLILDPSDTVLRVSVLVGLHWITSFGVSGDVLAGMLISAAALAAFGLAIGHKTSNRTAMLMLMPQYMLMVSAFIADAFSIRDGSLNGQSVDRIVLFAVLWPIMLGAICHSVAIIERHLTWTTTS